MFKQAIPALRTATQKGYLNIIVSNQSQIAHGLMSLEDFNAAFFKLLNFLHAQGAMITGVYVCPHRTEDNCICKKPQPYFIEQAINTYQLKRPLSYVIGDSWANDMVLAKNTGLNSILVLTGENVNSLMVARENWQDAQPTHIAKDCLDALAYV